MKIIVGKLTLFFPILFYVVLFVLTYDLFQHFTGLKLVALITHIYFIPLILFRVTRLILPFKPGISELSPYKEGFYWFACFRIQSVYEVIPVFEKFLRIVPSIYSVWLRLWGSKIGKNVRWTFSNDVYDRSDLTVGDDTLIGSYVTISQHIVVLKEGKFFVHYSPVVIGSRVLIGANTDIGPGTIIEDDAFVEFGTRAFGGRRMSDREVMMAVRKMKSISKF